jgi:hypothetical protein
MAMFFHLRAYQIDKLNNIYYYYIWSNKLQMLLMRNVIWGMVDGLKQIQGHQIMFYIWLGS